MRRELLLVRHVKSDWDDPSLADHDRPLAVRGEKALRRLRKEVARAEYRPDVVLCSSARRAVDTLSGIRPALPKRVRVDVLDELYMAGTSTLLARLRGLDEQVRSAMLIGHNPGIEDLAQLLSGSGDRDLREQLAAKVPTGALLTLSFEGPWTGLRRRAARLDALFVPRAPRA